MKYPTWIGVLILAGVMSLTQESLGKRLTNYEIFRAQVDTLSGSIVNFLTDRKIKSLSCRNKPGEMETFVRQKIEESLLHNNFRLLLDSAARAELSFSVPLAQVVYSSPVSSHIFSSPDVERTIRSSYDLDIADSGEVIFAKSFSFVFTDTVNESEIGNLESGSYGFVHGTLDPGGFMETMVQPVLFLASAAVIVYLFFTLRGS